MDKGGRKLNEASFCYEDMSDSTRQVALNINETFSDSPLYLHMKAEINLYLFNKTVIQSKYEYHFIQIPINCKSTLTITHPLEDYNLYHIKFYFMTEFQGDILTTFEFFISQSPEESLLIIIDYYRLFELFIYNHIDEEYTIHSEIMKKAEPIDIDENIYRVSLISEHMRYICVVENKKFTVLKLVRNYNGPPLGYFGSLIISIYKDSKHIHSEKWHAWYCRRRNLINYLTPTLVVDEDIESKDIFFIINKFGDPAFDLKKAIIFEKLTNYNTFSSPSIQIKKLSDISTPLSAGFPIYAVKSTWKEKSCSRNTIMLYRESYHGNAVIQAYKTDINTYNSKSLIIYNPLTEIC